MDLFVLSYITVIAYETAIEVELVSQWHESITM